MVRNQRTKKQLLNASVFVLVIPLCFISDRVFSDILCFLYVSFDCSFDRFVAPCDSHSFVCWVPSSVGCVIVFCVSCIALCNVSCCSSLNWGMYLFLLLFVFPSYLNCVVFGTG